jgi:hypothetical protein
MMPQITIRWRCLTSFESDFWLDYTNSFASIVGLKKYWKTSKDRLATIPILNTGFFSATSFPGDAS